MKHLKEFNSLFEDVQLTDSKKKELMKTMKERIQNEVDDYLSYDYSKNSRASDLKQLIDVVKENTSLDMKKILDDLNKKLASPQIQEMIFKSVVNGTEPTEAIDFIVKQIQDQVKSIIPAISDISWAKRKLIGAAMRVKHPSKEAFIKNLKSENAKDKGYKFNFGVYWRAIKGILITGANSFITKENYYISSDKKDKSRQNYNKFIDSVGMDSPSFKKKMESSFDKVLDLVWEAI